MNLVFEIDFKSLIEMRLNIGRPSSQSITTLGTLVGLQPFKCM